MTGMSRVLGLLRKKTRTKSSRTNGRESLETFPRPHGSRVHRRGRSCARHRPRHLGRRRHLRLSALCKMGRCLQKRDRRRAELPVDRLRRGHQADQGQDRHLRCVRRAAFGHTARRERSRSVPDGDGRYRAGGEHRRHHVRRSRPRRPYPRQDLPGRDQDLGRPRHRQAQSVGQAAVAADRGRASSDGSGTTYNFTYYLAEVSPEWKSKVGFNTSVEWPVGVSIGAKGNEGVANNVAQTKGSIGYVEYAHAKQNKLTYTKMVNKDGKTVAPTSATFQAAAANANWSSVPGYGVILANQPGAESWPMTAATWILLYKKPQDAAATAEALKFFAWAYDKGDEMAEELDYIPMPQNVVDSVKKTWADEVKDASGKPLFAM